MAEVRNSNFIHKRMKDNIFELVVAAKESYVPL